MMESLSFNPTRIWGVFQSEQCWKRDNWWIWLLLKMFNRLLQDSMWLGIALLDHVSMITMSIISLNNSHCMFSFNKRRIRVSWLSTFLTEPINNILHQHRLMSETIKAETIEIKQTHNSLHTWISIYSLTAIIIFQITQNRHMCSRIIPSWSRIFLQDNITRTE